MTYFILSLVGLLAGITASLGIGGGFVLLLYLTVLEDMPQKEAQLLNLIFFLPIATLSIIMHIRNKLILKEVVIKAVIGGVLGVFVGVWLATIVPNELISKAFAVFVLFVGLRELKSSKAK